VCLFICAAVEATLPRDAPILEQGTGIKDKVGAMRYSTRTRFCCVATAWRVITYVLCVCMRGVLLLQPQSLEWVAETMQKDADGDEAHEFLGPY